MDSTELSKICSFDKDVTKYFLGVFPVDKLPKHVPYPCCLIANTQPSSHQGEHWVAVFIDESKQGSYFCSYGQAANKQLTKWMNVHSSDWINSRKQLQGFISTTCGQYCLCYLHFRCNGVVHNTIMSLFSSDYHENDLIVTTFINGLYAQNTLVFDSTFIK